MDKEAKRLEKLAQQQKKKEEREQKKQEAKREKSLKRALSAASKNAKPNECVKVISCQIKNNFYLYLSQSSVYYSSH